MSKIKEIPIEEVMKGYVQHRMGAIFQVLKKKNDHTKVVLRKKNKHYDHLLSDIKSEIAKKDGDWRLPDKDKFIKFKQEDDVFVEMLTQKMIKRVILAQILLEVDEDLKTHNEHDRYLNNILDKSIKQCERISVKYYDRLYDIDGEMLQNMVNIKDRIAEKISKIEVGDWPHFEKHADEFFKSPESFRSDVIELDKID